MLKTSNHFRLMKSPVRSYSYISFSLDSSRPDCYLKQLEAELKKKAIEGTVLLDLLLANGNGSRRFVEVSFNGTSLNWTMAKIKRQNHLDQAIMIFCQSFYIKHKEVLEASILTGVQKYKISSQSLVSA